jgi:sulfite exporter TauE/SafE
VLETAGYWLANLMLVALGLYLMDAWRGLARLEQVGQVLWRRLRPVTALLLPVDSHLKLLAMGGLWGALPCGMVYSVLLTAMLSGSALSGAAVMIAFGLGTLPMLLAMGMAGAPLRGWIQRRPVRVACGVVVLGFGVLGMLRAAGGVSHGWIDALCLAAALP